MSMMFSPSQLRDARIARGLSPERLAIAVDRSSFTVRGWEAGKITPPTAVLGDLASALGVTIGDLFTKPDGR
jgi:ribosome-binding protein aMBF1 (putative translation factor)